ncbi:MAG: hypothetical protein KGD63_01670 [Candidatus Lokiarchaeota archaeon]|nr:hypothetical protein [Candidatus Lokiarchaeota archaeon]
MNISPLVIFWLAESKYKIKIRSVGNYISVRKNIHINGKLSQYFPDFQYWLQYLAKLDYLKN